MRSPAILGRFWAAPWSGPKMAFVSKVFVMDTPAAGGGLLLGDSGHPLAELGSGHSKDRTLKEMDAVRPGFGELH